MNSFVADTQPLAGGYRVIQPATPLFPPLTAAWSDDMMRDARPETNAFTPALSLVRAVIAALESRHSYGIAPFEGPKTAKRNEYIMCCREDGALLQDGMRGTSRETNTVEKTEASSALALAPTIPDALYFALTGQKAVCWVASPTSDHLITKRPAKSILLGDEQASLLLNMLMEELLSAKAGRLSISQHLLHALLLTVEREISRGHAVQSWSENEAEESQETDDDPIDHARQYIESHLTQPLTIESVARQVYMSRAQFAKRFREQTGRTFIDYMNDCRLRQAEKFLRETAWPIAHITEMVGFKSDSYFHRLFRREIGVSPMEYRRQHQPGQHQKDGEGAR